MLDKNRKRETMSNLVLPEVISQKIYLIRGHKVMIDNDLAKLYGVTTSNLNKAVARNIYRFPGDFMFKLNKKELSNLIFHFGTSSWGGIRKLPRVFTEHGILMLSSVLKNKRATQVNIQIMRAFVKLRQILSTHKELAHKLKELERKTEKHDTEIQAIFEAIRQLMAPPEQPKRKIGFHRE
jgi:hypothetical protein